MRIYADNAATTPMRKQALEAMMPYFTDYYGNPSSMHETGQKASEALTKARLSIARSLGCTPREITFTSGGTESDNQAIRSAAAIGKKFGKCHIITTSFEHHAVLHTLKKLEQEGFEVTYLEVPESGVISSQQVSEALREDTCLITIMMANNEIGTIQPIEEIGAIARAHDILFHTDAVQAAGHIPIDIAAQHIDMLSISGHKFGGPKGIGVLYARKDIALINLLEGGSQERGKRPGTENLPAIVGMSVALSLAVESLPQTTTRLCALRDELIDALSKLPGAILNGDAHSRLPGNINFCFEGCDNEMMLLMLNERGISASAGSACTAGSLEPSHVLLAIGRSPQIARTSLRLTLSDDITHDEVAYIAQCITEVHKKICRSHASQTE